MENILLKLKGKWPWDESLEELIDLCKGEQKELIIDVLRWWTRLSNDKFLEEKANQYLYEKSIIN